MIPRRNADGWRDLGPLTWKVEREDYPCDNSTNTNLHIAWIAHWSLDITLARPWKREGNNA